MAPPIARPNELLAFGMGGGRDIAYLTEPPSASVDARRVWAPLMLLALVLMAPLGSGSTLPASSTVGDPTWNGVDAIDVFEDRAILGHDAGFLIHDLNSRTTVHTSGTDDPVRHAILATRTVGILALGSEVGTILEVRTEDQGWAPVERRTIEGITATMMAVRPDGSQLLLAHGGTLETYDLPTLDPRPPRSISEGRITGLVPVPNSNGAVVADDMGVVRVLDNSGGMLRMWTHGNTTTPITALAVHPSGAEVIVANADGAIERRTMQGNLTSQHNMTQSWVEMTWSSERALRGWGTDDGTYAIQLDPMTWSGVETHPLASRVSALEWIGSAASTSGDRFIHVGGYGAAFLHEANHRPLGYGLAGDDLDGDGVPDDLDADIDGDGQLNEADTTGCEAAPRCERVPNLEDLRQVTILIDENRIVVEDRFLLDGTYSAAVRNAARRVLIPDLTLSAEEVSHMVDGLCQDGSAEALAQAWREAIDLPLSISSEECVPGDGFSGIGTGDVFTRSEVLIRITFDVANVRLDPGYNLTVLNVPEASESSFLLSAPSSPARMSLVDDRVNPEPPVLLTIGESHVFTPTQIGPEPVTLSSLVMEYVWVLAVLGGLIVLGIFTGIVRRTNRIDLRLEECSVCGALNDPEAAACGSCSAVFLATEVLDRMKQWLLDQGMSGRGLFERLDLDRSGALDPSELQQGLISMKVADLGPREIDQLIRVMDEDGNGEIELDEFLDALDLDQLGVESTDDASWDGTMSGTVHGSEEGTWEAAGNVQWTSQGEAHWDHQEHEVHEEDEGEENHPEEWEADHMDDPHADHQAMEEEEDEAPRVAQRRTVRRSIKKVDSVDQRPSQLASTPVARRRTVRSAPAETGKDDVTTSRRPVVTRRAIRTTEPIKSEPVEPTSGRDASESALDEDFDRMMRQISKKDGR